MHRNCRDSLLRITLCISAILICASQLHSCLLENARNVRLQASFPKEDDKQRVQNFLNTIKYSEFNNAKLSYIQNAGIENFGKEESSAIRILKNLVNNPNLNIKIEAIIGLLRKRVDVQTNTNRLIDSVKTYSSNNLYTDNVINDISSIEDAKNILGQLGKFLKLK